MPALTQQWLLNLHGWSNTNYSSPVFYFLALPFPTSHWLLPAFELPQMSSRYSHTFLFLPPGRFLEVAGSRAHGVNYDTFYWDTRLLPILKQDYLFKKFNVGKMCLLHHLVSTFSALSLFLVSCMFCNPASNFIKQVGVSWNLNWPKAIKKTEKINP